MWWWVAAHAAEPYEVTVEATRLSTAQEAVHRELRREGYRKIVRLGQRSYYLHPLLWKPNVMIHNQGFSRVRGVQAIPAGLGYAAPVDARFDSKAPIPDTPPPTPLTFTTQSRRKARNQAETLAGQLEPYLAEVRDARWELARAERAVALRDELVRIWFDGVGPDGEPLPDEASRRRALERRLQDTAEGPAGEWAREIVREFIESEAGIP